MMMCLYFWNIGGARQLTMRKNEQSQVLLRHHGLRLSMKRTNSEYVEEENMRGVAEVAYITLRGCPEAFEAGKQRVEITTF
jgi:hypothetical protein